MSRPEHDPEEASAEVSGPVPPDDASADAAVEPAEPTEPAWVRRKRLAAVFGDVLPDQTRDERGPEGSAAEGKGDDWYLRQKPPHHG